MKSFGLWYLLNSLEMDKHDPNESAENRESEKTVPKFELHVNFWSLEEYKHMSSKKVPCLDIGIMIKNYALIKEMTFYCPFFLEESDYEDLAEKMSTKNNANIIFNEECTIINGNYTTVKTEKEELLIFPLNQAIKVFEFCNNEDRATYFKFRFQDFQKYVNTDARNSELQKISTLYVRFRIRGNALKRNIYFDSEPLNKSFESAFSGTRMIDFKINEKRNIQDSVRARIALVQAKLASFDNVHFLAMEPSAHEVKTFDNQQMSCRELEENLWDDYLDEKLDFSKGHILAYHWKQKEKKASYSCLVKINYSKARPVTIFSYALIVVALGILSSVVVTGANVLIPNDFNVILLCGGIGAGLLIVGILIGNRLK